MKFVLFSPSQTQPRSHPFRYSVSAANPFSKQQLWETLPVSDLQSNAHSGSSWQRPCVYLRLRWCQVLSRNLSFRCGEPYRVQSSAYFWPLCFSAQMKGKRNRDIKGLNNRRRQKHLKVCISLTSILRGDTPVLSGHVSLGIRQRRLLNPA